MTPETAADLCRGVCRLLVEQGRGPLTEVTLRTGRRADVLALDRDGLITIVEVKSSLADFRADAKWGEYLEFCDLFFFAVGPAFPRERLPGDHGLIIADRYGAVVERPAPLRKLAGARRKALTLRFGLLAAQRLQMLADAGVSPASPIGLPPAGVGEPLAR